MSLDLTKKPFKYYPRRSLCDSCKIEICTDRNERSDCPTKKFEPKSGFVFHSCEICERYFEVHSARKSDRHRICPTCQKNMNNVKKKKVKENGKTLL